MDKDSIDKGVNKGLSVLLYGHIQLAEAVEKESHLPCGDFGLLQLLLGYEGLEFFFLCFQLGQFGLQGLRSQAVHDGGDNVVDGGFGLPKLLLIDGQVRGKFILEPHEHGDNRIDHIVIHAQLVAADANQDGIINQDDGELIRSWLSNEETAAQYPNIGTYISIANVAVPTIEYYPNLIGDVNGDGSITTADAGPVAAVLAGNISADEISLVKADANGDKIINQTDVDMINQYVLTGVAPEGSYIGMYEPDTANSEYTIEYTTTE